MIRNPELAVLRPAPTRFQDRWGRRDDGRIGVGISSEMFLRQQRRDGMRGDVYVGSTTPSR